MFWLVLTCKPVHLSCLLPPILMTTTGYLYPLPNTLNTFVLSFLYAILHHHTYICIWEYVPFTECSTGHCNIQEKQQLTQCFLLRRTSPGQPRNQRTKGKVFEYVYETISQICLYQVRRGVYQTLPYVGGCSYFRSLDVVVCGMWSIRHSVFRVWEYISWPVF